MRRITILALCSFGLVFGLPEINQFLSRSPANSEPASHKNANQSKAQRHTPTQGGAANLGWNEIAIERDRSGHFIVDIAVNGTPITFMIDSGASDVVLSKQDARRAGINGYLARDLRYQTANGIVEASSITLRDMRIGQMMLHSVPAAVNEGPMTISLLGMSFLSKLQGFEFDGDRLLLRW